MPVVNKDNTADADLPETSLAPVIPHRVDVPMLVVGGA
jgi:hypothetical protein